MYILAISNVQRRLTTYKDAEVTEAEAKTDPKLLEVTLIIELILL